MMPTQPSMRVQRSWLGRFWRAFGYSARREGQFLVQHRWDFAMLFWMPIVLMFLVWWVFSKGMAVDIPIAVVDHDQSAQSAALMRYIDATPEVTIVSQLYDPQAVKYAIETTQVYAVVEIPANFSKNLLAAEPTRVLLNVNAQFGSHSGMIQKSVQTAVTTFSAGAEIQRRVAF